MTTGIYMITLNCGCRYIGQSTDILSRLQSHSFYRFKNKIKKVEILDICNKKYLHKIELQRIKSLTPELNISGYNNDYLNKRINHIHY